MTTLINKRIPVLDQGFVELLDFMPHPSTGIPGDLAIVNAARVSFLGESKGVEADKKLLMYLFKHNHSSPFEMVEFKFRIRAPLVTWWQWVRHRMAHYASMNAQSGRYTEFEENAFYMPEEWRLQSASNKQGSDGKVKDWENDWLKRELKTHINSSFSLYEWALSLGVAKEQARLFLPGFCAYYTWVVKVDAHNLLHFLKLRMAAEAQYEIRVYAQTIYDEFFKPLLPWTAEAYEESLNEH